MVLGRAALVAFLGCTDFAASLRFYRDTLGLALIEETPFALVFDAGGTTLRVTRVDRVADSLYTVLGWEVTDIAACVAALVARRVEFARFEGLEQDAAGAWTSPSGAQVAWFRDPDGNLLSITEP